MKMLKVLLLFFCVLYAGFGYSQDAVADSLLNALNTTTDDTIRVNLLNQISKSYFNSSPEEARKYALQGKELAEKAGYKYGLANSLKNVGISYYAQAEYLETLTYWTQSLKEFESINDKTGIANMLSNIGAVYFNQGDDENALDYYLNALKYSEANKDTFRIATVLNNIGAVYFNKKATHDKAKEYYLKAWPICEKINDNDLIGTIAVNLGEIYQEENNDSSALKYFERSLKAYEGSKNIPYSLNDIGKLYLKQGNYAKAIQYHSQALETAEKLSAKLDMMQSYNGIAATYFKKGDIGSALTSYMQAQNVAKEIDAQNYTLKETYEGLSNSYAATGDFPNAFKYQKLLTDLKDSLYNIEKDKKQTSLQLTFDMKKKQAQIDLLTSDKALKELDLKRQTIVRNSLIAVLSLVTIIVFILFRNYRIKDKTNSLLDNQKNELQQTLNELKNTQSLLIQSEKMASLGELTAGIAHEIQNPLNFVNNFSDVNTELIDELREELATGNLQLANEIAIDIKENEAKINHHGKRADGIVKGMLQHSRSGTGDKEPTDINKLADEYFRLSYHGIRSKDNDFNADIKNAFDETTGNINVVPQDIGRVLLNLYNNAFYAVNEKSKLQTANYKPQVSVTTKRINGKIEISVTDNGNGIPQNIVDKIFQPFFTTKPTGSGTGLGLSLSYDIVKAHGGEIKVRSTEGQGTEFIIQLPLS